MNHYEQNGDDFTNTDSDNAMEAFANNVYDTILDQIFQPAAPGENIDAYFKRLGIDPQFPPVGFLKVLEKVQNASVQLSHANVWVIATRFTALLFAMRDQPNAQHAIKELAKTMPEFPLEPLLDQPPTEYARDVLHPESAEQQVMKKLDILLSQRVSDQATGSGLSNPLASVGSVGIGAPRRYDTRQILHIECGNDLWTPNAKELADIVTNFQTATLAPEGAIVATRHGVKTNIIETSINPEGLMVALSDRNVDQLNAEQQITMVAASTIPVPKLEGHDLIKHLWSQVQSIPKIQHGVVIDESGFFTLDANGDRFPLYVASSLSREEHEPHPSSKGPVYKLGENEN